MDVLVIGNSSIAQRRILPAMERLPEIHSISIGTSNITERDLPSNSKIATIYPSYENALAESKAQIVYISTINSCHEEIADKALDKGCHVIVDKPAFLNLASSRRLIEKASNKKLLLAEAAVFLSHPIYVEISKISETLGPLTRVVGVFSMPPFLDDNFRYHKNLGGGALNDLGPYAVAMSRFFMHQPPQKVACTILQNHPTSDVEISFALTAQYGDGKSMVGLFGFDTEYQNHIRAFGPKVSIFVDRAYTPPPDGQQEILVRSENQASSISIDPADSFEIAITNMLQAINSEDFEPYYAALLADAEMLDLMRESALADR